MMIDRFVKEYWEVIQQDPLSDEVKRQVWRYAYALMAQRKFYNRQKADDIAEKVMELVIVKLLPQWESVSAGRYAGFLVRTTQNLVREHFRRYKTAIKKLSEITDDIRRR